MGRIFRQKEVVDKRGYCEVRAPAWEKRGDIQEFTVRGGEEKRIWEADLENMAGAEKSISMKKSHCRTKGPETLRNKTGPKGIAEGGAVRHDVSNSGRCGGIDAWKKFRRKV